MALKTTLACLMNDETADSVLRCASKQLGNGSVISTPNPTEKAK